MPSEALLREKERVAYMEAQEGLYQEALERLDPRVRKYFEGQYSAGGSLGGGRHEGEFVGLCCKSCRHWISCGHDESCAVPDVMKLLNLKLVIGKPNDDASARTESA